MSAWRRKPNGKPYADLRDVGMGKRSLLSPAVIREHGATPPDEVCERLFDELMAKLGPTLGKGAVSKDYTVAALVSWYCDVYHAAAPETSKLGRAFALRAWEDWCKVQRIENPKHFDTVAAQTFAKHLMTEPVGRGKLKSSRKPKSVHVYLAHVKACIRAAVDTDLLERDPVRKWPVVKLGRKNVEPYTVEQVREVLDAAYEHRRHFYPVYLFCAAMGWRISDVVGLRETDLDLTRGISHRRCKKTGEPLPCALNALALEAIAMGKRGGGYVFTYRGKPMDSQSTYAGLREAAKAAGITYKVNHHRFRHACAVELAKSGVPIAVIAQVLGHANPATTLKHYQQFLPGSGSEALAAYGEKLRGNTGNVTPLKLAE